ncbi:MAG: hypothetical protein MGU50_06330 [Trichodesmium sp. MAG_R02]|nr:hypothetical protein [Trichodesmium sp. MAG_R02]
MGTDLCPLTAAINQATQELIINPTLNQNSKKSENDGIGLTQYIYIVNFW